MKWSARIARVRGIDIRLHVTFPLIIVFFAAQFWVAMGGWRGALFGLVASLLLFVCVVLHELGHSLVAQRFGAEVRDITLWPIGGVARMTEMPRRPAHEFMVSAAGPMVNFVITAVLAVLTVGLMASGAWPSLASVQALTEQPTWQALLSYLLTANLLLGLFNLIPAFPMDGGRILRSLLALRLDYVPATRIAVAVGQGIALIVGLLGLLGYVPLTLVLIAIFIFFGAGQEGQATAARELLGDIRVYQAASRTSRSVSPGDPLSRVVDLTLSTHQSDFMVLDDQQLVGVLTRSALIDGLRRHGPDIPVAEVMCGQYPSTSPEETLLAAQRKMSGAKCEALPVLEGDVPVALLTMADVNEAYTLAAISPQSFAASGAVTGEQMALAMGDHRSS